MKRIPLLICSLLTCICLFGCAVGCDLFRKKEKSPSNSPDMQIIAPSEDPTNDPAGNQGNDPTDNQTNEAIAVETFSSFNDAPASDLGFADSSKTVDVSAITASSMGKSEQVANMIVSASYNNILIDQFCFVAHVDVQTESKASFSDYCRVKTGANMFYQAYAYTGTINAVVTRIDYGNQRLSQSNIATYDKNDKKWTATLNNPNAETRNQEVTLPDLTPYNIYSWYGFPLDLGGVKSRQNKSSATEGRTAAIDYSLIDNASAKITLMTDRNGKEYYRITFDADIEKVQASEETLARFEECFDLMENVEFRELHFTVEIWKDLGVFRQISYDAKIEAKISGNREEANITKTIDFGYADEDASVAKRIKDLASYQSQKWYTKWSTENKAKIDAAYDALQQKLGITEDAD